MTLGQLRGITRLLNCESSGTVASLQVFEAIDRNTTCSGSELQETRFPLRWPTANTFPEPLDDLVIHLVATVIGKLRPVIDVDLGHASNQQFQLTFVKDSNEILRDQFIES